MRIVHDLKQARPAARSYVTIGVFDGVHRGHQHLITSMVGAAHSTRHSAIAITFDPHPAQVLGYESPPLLTTAEERVDLLAALGLDVLVVLPFTRATARTTATDFVEALIHHLHLAEVWGGADFALGYRCEGDIPFLQRLGARRGFTVRIVEPLAWEGAPVSSSRVRDALKAGDIPQVTGCLGRPYCLAGVVQGRGPGTRSEVSMVSISLPRERMIPAGGVYACLAHAECIGTRAAVVNISTRSTCGGISEGQEPVVAAYVLDFDAGLHDQVLRLDFVARLRDERTFPTPNAWVEQVHADMVRARAILDGLTAAGGLAFPC